MRRYISDEPVRTETVKARVTVEEKAALEAAAASLGVTLATLLRSAGQLAVAKNLPR
jgi:uncharacterized protein (DUF1778 family)